MAGRSGRPAPIRKTAIRVGRPGAERSTAPRAGRCRGRCHHSRRRVDRCRRDGGRPGADFEGESVGQLDQGSMSFWILCLRLYRRKPTVSSWPSLARTAAVPAALGRASIPIVSQPCRSACSARVFSTVVLPTPRRPDRTCLCRSCVVRFERRASRTPRSACPSLPAREDATLIRA